MGKSAGRSPTWLQIAATRHGRPMPQQIQRSLVERFGGYEHAVEIDTEQGA